MTRASTVDSDSSEIPARVWRRSVAFIALGAGVASFSMNFWTPFLPIYMQELGAESEASALFWSATAMASNGVFRILGGPLWGVLADRYGRKPMFVRALFAATVTTLIAFFATAPWHVCVAMACQGFFSGFIPAAVALTSVSVPKSRLTSALGQVQGAQYLGNTIGPALGAGLALAFGSRGAILVAAMMPAAVATVVLLAVPRDRVTPRAKTAQAKPRARWTETLMHGFGLQFLLGLLLYFMIFMMGQLVRTAAPVAIGQIGGQTAATGATGIAFSIAGAASVVGALVVSRFVGRPGHVRLSLTLAMLAAAGAYAVLGLAGSVPLFVAGFALAQLLQGATLPATNTLIAANVPPERRGTAFGVASSVQALSFIVGPYGAALFAAVSLELGFLVLGASLAITALMTFVLLREPDLVERVPAPPGREPSPPAAEAPARS